MGAGVRADVVRDAGSLVDSTQGLLLVKLAPPQTSPPVARPHLVRRLVDNAATPLTLVCAPVGWGKTSLLADWLHDPREKRPVAWLSLDGGDDDPGRFWRYVVAAVRSVLPHVGEVAAGGLLVPGADPVSTAIPALLNDLAASDERAVLVLDDYHAISDPRIHEALEFFLTYLPSSLRVVLSTHHDPPLPLPRLRGRGQLTELRAADLRLSVREVAALLGASLGVEVGDELAAELAARTEGWPVAVQLAGVAVRGSDDPRDQLRRLPDDHRDLTELLLSEVLAGLDAEDEDRLVRTAVLGRLSDPLCEAVLGTTVEPGWLQRLERSGLPLTAGDHRGVWFRLHALVAQVLRRRLDQRFTAAAISELHARAASWFCAQGDEESAVGHLLAGGQHDRAAGLLMGSLHAFLSRGAVGSYIRFGDELPAELVEADARLAVTLAWANSLGGRHERGRQLIALVGNIDDREAPPPPGWRSTVAAATALQVCFLYVTDADELRRLARLAADREDDPHLPGFFVARAALGLAHLAGGYLADAITAFESALSPQLDLLPTGSLVTVGLLGGARLEKGDVDGARALLDGWLPRLEAMEASAGDACAAATLTVRSVAGQLARLRGDLPGARAQLERAVAAGRVFGVAAPLCDALVSLAEVKRLERRPADARTLLLEAQELVADVGAPSDTIAKLAAAEQLLGRNAQRTARHEGTLVEDLTERELSILRALQGTMSLRQLAGELYLSLNTVKGYVKALYRKLDVRTRADAVARGRELGLI
jgi:LuxR family maltose regulon positive regulatory protein